ncbi:hypothetical protein CP8484711_0611B, partial [Chlamydia psittaci 84-8471/1]
LLPVLRSSSVALVTEVMFEKEISVVRVYVVPSALLVAFDVNP